MTSQERNKEDIDNTNEPAVVLSICYSGGFMGAAVYQQDCTTIKILNDIAEDLDFHLIDSLIYQVEPTIILLNKDQDIIYVRHVSQICGLLEPPIESCENDQSGISSIYDDSIDSKEKYEESVLASKREAAEAEENEEEEPNIKVHLLSNATYSLEGAKKRISMMFASECYSADESSLVVNFRLDTTNVNMIRALGALLIYMDSARTGVEYEALNKVTPITAIKSFVIDQMMEVDSMTYRALEIFGENRKKEVSWKKVVSSDGRKASVFSLCNRSRSALGRYMLRKWFEHPTLNMNVLSDRQEAISYFIQDSNSDIVNNLIQSLGQVRSLRLVLRKMKSSSCSVLHWENLFKTLLALVDIGRCIAENRIQLDLMNDHMKYFGDALTEITTVLATLCDFDESRLENRIVIKSGMDKTLDEVKHLYRSLPSFLTQVAKEEADRLRADRCSVGYIPMVGYVLQLPKKFPVGDYPDLQLLFCNEADVNVKSSKMETLDQDLGDLKMQIIDKETTIMLRLQNLILRNTTLILGACRGAAVLDAIIALALTAKFYGWSRPALVDYSVIDAVDVNHPLALIVSRFNSFVSNPVNSGNEFSKVKIFTGPNACGKSVYLKQVGVLAFLAHVGSFVPAKKAIIGPINKIMTRMYTVDGVLDGMSTFAKDLTQVATALRRGNGNSLVIMDEFGKGTMTEVGLSLLVSSLNHWIRKGAESCPHLFVSSHFHALPELLAVSRSLVSFHTLEVIKRGAQLVFKYRLVNGVVSKSFASYTARQMGIPKPIVERADEIYELLRRGGSLAEVKAIQEEEIKCDWLAQRVDSFMYEFETWDIDQDVGNLIKRIEEIFLLEDEVLASVEYNKFSKTADTVDADISNQTSVVVDSQNYEQQSTGDDTSTKAAISKEDIQIQEDLDTESTERSRAVDEILKRILKSSKKTQELTPSGRSERFDHFSFKGKSVHKPFCQKPDLPSLDTPKTYELCTPRERSILKTPSSRSRGNLSVSFLLDDKKDHNDCTSSSLHKPKKIEMLGRVDEDLSFVIPLVESSPEPETSEDVLPMDTQEEIRSSFIKSKFGNTPLQTPIMNQMVLKTPIMNRTVVKTPTRNQSAFKTPIMNQSAFKTPIMNQSAFKTPIMNQSAFKTPIMKQSAFKTQIMNQSAFQTPIMKNQVSKTPTMNERVLGISIMNQQDFKTPTTRQRLFETPTMNHQVSKTPTMNERVLGTPIMNQQDSKTPTTRQSLFETPIMKQQDSKTPTTCQRLFETPTMNHQVSKTPTMNEKVVRTPMMNQRVFQTPIINQSFFKNPVMNQSVFKTPKANPVAPIYGIKRNMDISILSCLSEEKSVPLKRLRSC
ncbi:unnamed protein product [Auanema sp. JU1783]|nr:unnamed protein product [Auanema sp. JU1783]